MDKIDMKKNNLAKLDVNRYLAGEAKCRFEGLADKTIKFIEEFQLMDTALWERFVAQYQMQPDGEDNGWRGEYWGKMMRGASLVYTYTQNQQLYEVLTNTVKKLVECSEEDGRISTYSREMEFKGWDVWCRKYVMLGMQYFLEICTDKQLAGKIVKSMCEQADYILSKVGPAEEGKIPITETTSLWRGLNSSSLLEPIVRLYNLTKEEKYLDFAQYIVDEGGVSIANIFKLAYENKFYPYQYPVTKAYEMISCFEGLLEFYRVKQIEWYRIALENFADRILESDFTIIGGCGCTHELFDHSTVRQANTNNNKIMQETCVTVTLMKFFYQMTLLTGKSSYVDSFERSWYNAYLGAVNTEKSIDSTIEEIYPNAVIEPLPFDSYSPLTVGTRGICIGGIRLMADSHYYGCCACIGSAGAGVMPKMALMKSKEGIAVNLYIPGTMETLTPSGKKVKLILETTYPRSGEIRIRISTEDKEPFTISLRNPAWSKETEVNVNDESVDVTEGYISLNRMWSGDDVIKLNFDMRTEAIYPISYGHQILMNERVGKYDYMLPSYDEEDSRAKYHLALRRGPIILAVDSQLGYDAGNIFDIDVTEDGYVETRFSNHEIAPYENIIELEVPMKNKHYFRVTDYASAGKLWNKESKIAAWILTDGKEKAE